MTNKSNDLCTRRILYFPVTRPCESVSFPTLLAALIRLGRSICSFKAKPIFTNRKNAKTAVHLVQTLLVFLEEIPQDKNPKFSESSVLLSLSELHCTFQKLLFLLEDCGRENSRLWLLMQAEKVSSHFQSLIRNISVALDVLPLSGLEVPDEARELVELVNRQARKASFVVETGDKRAAGWVMRTIDRFESEGIGPKSGDLKRVLDYLGIRTWNDCNNEIKFLEGPTGPECSGKTDEARLVCSLIAFSICCRCVVFENLEGSGNSVSLGRFDFKVVGFPNLDDDFRCPISLEIMADPVTIATGHTYDRRSIAKWLDSGNRTCPKTGERLGSVELISNLTLKRLIMQWCHENKAPSPGECSRNVVKLLDFAAGSRAANRAAKFIAHFLAEKILSGNDEERGKACHEIHLLTKTSIFCRAHLVEANAIPALLDSIRHEKNQEAEEENTVAALMNLSKLAEGRNVIIKNRGADKIIEVLNRGAKMETRARAAGVLFYLSSVEGFRETIGRHPGAVAGLVGLIQAGPGRCRRNGLAAASGLLASLENHGRFLSAGLVPTLVDALTRKGEERGDAADLLAVLVMLAQKADGAKAIIRAGGLPVIIEILGSFGDYCFSRASIECCVSILLALCTHDGPGVVPVLVRDVSVMSGLYSVLAGGPGGPSRKAGLLIGILHEFGQRSPAGPSTNPGFGPEQFVHVW